MRVKVINAKSLFFELLKVSTQKLNRLSVTPSKKDWESLFFLAQMHSLIGVCFSGIEKLGNEQLPPKELLLKWYALTKEIEERNKILNQRSMAICELLHKNGFIACILKGQGVATYYPNPLRRQSGDIDVWVRTDKGNLRSDRVHLIEYVRNIYPKAGICYHHIHFDYFDDVEVELHFMPTRLYCRTKDIKLQKWIEQTRKEQFANIVYLQDCKINTPTKKFNAVFLLLHIAKHILEEGIGLRQLMDYYYLLEKNDNLIGRKDFENLFQQFGLLNMAQAVMYVLQEIFGIDKNHMLCEPDEKLGNFLIEEIMLSGNFGHFDSRFGDLTNETLFHKFLRKQIRAFRFFRFSPSETMWSPLFSIYQRCWGYYHGYC